MQLYRTVLRSRVVRKQLADQIRADKLVMDRYKLIINLNLTKQICVMKQMQFRKAQLVAQKQKLQAKVNKRRKLLAMCGTEQ